MPFQCFPERLPDNNPLDCAHGELYRGRNIWFISGPNTISKHLVFNLEEIKQEDCLTLLIISDFSVIIYVLISTSEQRKERKKIESVYVCVGVF